MGSTERKSTIEEPVYTDIRQCWDKVKPGIVEIIREDPFITFIPEDVYSECVNERAFLYTSSVGFLILAVEVDQFTKDKTLYMWLAYTYEKGGHNWMAHEEWFNRLASEAGCRYIEARSHIPELEPYAVADGWNTEKVYRKRVK